MAHLGANVRKTARVRRRSTLAAVLVSAALALCLLPGCDAIQTNDTVEVKLEPKLAQGVTIADGTLTVGINATNTPYGGTNANGETVGLDYDIAAALADELGMKLQIVDVNSNGKAALADSQADVVLGMTKSGTSKTETYSNSYINDGASLYCLDANAPASITEAEAALADNKVLVQTSTPVSYDMQQVLGIEGVVSKTSMQEAFEALEKGECKYLAADAVLGDYFARNYTDMVRVNYLAADRVVPMYALTLTEKSELTQAVDAALDSIAEKGLLRIIVAKWLGADGATVLPGVVDTKLLPESYTGQ